jgi:hypothetical protein
LSRKTVPERLLAGVMAYAVTSVCNCLALMATIRDRKQH